MKYIVRCIPICLLLLIFSACETLDGLEPQPQQSLSAGEAIKDANGAESALTGTYSFLNQDGYFSRMFPVYGSVLSGYLGSTTGTTRDITFQSESNSVRPSDNTLGNTWDDIYEVANAASNVITRVGELSDTDGFSGSRRTEIIAEAKFLRAMAHFDALRFFGQFWDNSSALGVPLRLEPGDAINAQLPRSSVSEVYASIQSDLDGVIADAGAFSASYFASQEAGIALKARAALYVQDYALAAQLADQVIQGGVFSLEPNYGDIFVNRLNSSEVIFAMFSSQTEGSGHTFFHLSPSSDLGAGRYDYGPTTQYTDMISGDPREAASIGVTSDGPEVRKYPNLTAGDDPTYIIRLAELYFIKAEALARSGGDLSEATDAVNTVRARAGLDPVSAGSADELLAIIQEERVKELAFEGSHEWFDAIRYGNIGEVKPTVINENQWALPIPDIEVDPNDQLDQNPGY